MQEVAAAVSVRNLDYRYRDHLSSSFSTLHNITFTVNEGDILGIIGPNGAGKSTLFRCMLGLLEDYRGEIAIFGHDVRKDKRVLREIGYIPQQRSLERTFPATVQEIISLGLTDNKDNNSQQKINSALRTVGLEALKDRRIGNLSGGQQQRALIAKALVNDARLLILDEPTTSIDVETQNKFYSLIRTLNQKNKVTILLSSHDLDAISKIANKLACINRTMFFHGSTNKFFSSPELLKTYSESIMQAHMHTHSNQNGD
ncbi:MAG TPA: metal ABC transporter ATP-binding protein [Nitrososphaeraceae archaeon]|jgi:zinc transport system ATP-binding protein